ncbi:MAG TPA: 4-oxalocrotonate tautomerase family protein [Solirubrobacterales bacterium]|nr:4-oxalocrotonate tautomerase family protein [Solirubrobacterales bacterium]
MPYVHVHLLEGRDDATKAELARRLTEVVCEVAAVSPESVWVRLDEMRPTDFAVAGKPKSASGDLPATSA